jgi:hypothetical protein
MERLASLTTALVFGTTIACGSRTSADAVGDTTGNEVATSTHAMTCKPGDPSVTLATGLATQQFNGLATDGRRLYVAQSDAPQFWSIDTRGRASLWTETCGATTSASSPLPILPAGDRVFFNTLGFAPSRLVWSPATGGGVHVVSSMTAAAFARSGAVAFTGGYEASSIESISLPSGSARPFFRLQDNFQPSNVVTTDRFLHLLSQSPPFVDLRVDVSTGRLFDQVPFDAENTQVVAGPNAICAGASGRNGIVCLADSATTQSFPAVGSSVGAFPMFMDSDWVYVGLAHHGGRSLTRFSVAGGKEETVLRGEYPGAVTARDGCVYVGFVSFPARGTIQRIAAPSLP